MEGAAPRFESQDPGCQVHSNLEAGEFLLDFNALKLLIELRLTTRNFHSRLRSGIRLNEYMVHRWQSRQRNALVAERLFPFVLGVTKAAISGHQK